MKKVNGLLLGGAMALSFAGVIGATSATKDVKEVKADDAVLMIGTHDMIASPSFSSGGGTATYDSSTRTLTLTNFSYSGESYRYNSDSYTGFCVQGLTDLKIKLSGTNVIKGVYNINNEYAAVAGGVIWADTTISALDPTGEKPSLSFIAAQSTVMSQYRTAYGTYSYRSLSLSGIVFNSYTESATSLSNYGFYGSDSNKTLTITNCITRFEGSSSDGNSAGISTICALDVSGSTVSATGGNAKNSYGILIDSINCKKVAFTKSNIEAIARTATEESTGFAMQTRFSISKSNFVAIGESYGFKSKQSSTQSVTIGNDMKRFTLSGNVRAAAGNISLKNAYAGYGWENAAGTGDPSNINATPGGAVYIFKRISFGKITYTATACEAVTYDGDPHLMMSVTVSDPTSDYVVKYKKDGDTDYSISLPYESEVGEHTVYYQIEAKDYTTATGSVIFTINKMANSWTTNPVGATNLKYDGTAKSLLTTVAEATNGTISYTLDNVATDVSELKATLPGTYSIRVHCEPDEYHEPLADILVSVTIDPADIINPSVVVTSEPFNYDGQLHHPTLQTSGELVGGGSPTFTYSKTVDGEYTSDIPEEADAGEHTIYWKAEAENHTTATGSVVFEILKVDSSYEAEPTAKENLSFTGSSQELVNAGEAEGGVIMYRVGDEGDFSEDLPSEAEVGTYVVNYFIKGDQNHNDGEVKSVSVTIAEASKEQLIKSIENGDKLHDLIKDKYPEIDGALATALTEGKAVKDNAGALPKEIVDATNKINEACVSAVEKLVESIGEIKNDEQSKESIELARAAYESLSDEQKLLVPQKTLADLEAKEAEYKKAASSGLAWWAIALIVVACLAVVFALLYVLMFYVFHKWIKQDKKAVKVFKCGHKHGKARLFTKSLKVVYRFDEEVFKTKDEALK